MRGVRDVRHVHGLDKVKHARGALFNADRVFETAKEKGMARLSTPRTVKAWETAVTWSKTSLSSERRLG